MGVMAWDERWVASGGDVVRMSEEDYRQLAVDPTSPPLSARTVLEAPDFYNETEHLGRIWLAAAAPDLCRALAKVAAIGATTAEDARAVAQALIAIDGEIQAALGRARGEPSR